MKRVGTRGSARCVAGAGLLLCSLAWLWPEPEELSPFALAVGVWPGMETLTLARERGVLPKGELNFVELAWTSATMMAFENRVVDGAVVTLDEMLRLRSGGHAIKAVLVMGESAGGDAILAKPSLGSLRDLRGKRVGVELRASGEYLLTRALRSVGMSVNDLTIVPLNSVEAENAYAHGELDAVVTRDPSRIRLIDSGARVLFDSAEMPGGLFRVLVVRADVSNERADALRSVINAHFEMMPELRSARGKGRGMGAVLRRERLTVEQFTAALERTVDFSRDANAVLLSDGAGSLEPVLEEIAAFMKQEGILEPESSWQDLLDDRFVKGKS